MCGDCSAKKAEYEKLLERLNNALEKARTALTAAQDIQTQFSSVNIDGSPLGSEVFDNCIPYFNSTVSNLNSRIAECKKLIDSIVCTHMYEDEKKKR